MGYKEGDAKKALRMNNQDVQSAVNFLVEEKEKAAIKREEDRRRQREILLVEFCNLKFSSVVFGPEF